MEAYSVGVSRRVSTILVVDFNAVLLRVRERVVDDAQGAEGTGKIEVLPMRFLAFALNHTHAVDEHVGPVV